MDLLNRLLQAAEAGGRRGSAIEILVLLSLAHHALGDIPAALTAIQHALTAAEPEGYVRVFADEGRPVAQLLSEIAGGTTTGYAHRLLQAFAEGEEAGATQGGGAAGDVAPVAQPPVEPLSERELEVLRLLGSDLSGPEIAGVLVVSLNTMHTHTRNIYTKLGVNSRRAAVRRAEELHLL
jgi:LuxR family maltose regulon positive regulatory protein